MNKQSHTELRGPPPRGPLFWTPPPNRLGFDGLLFGPLLTLNLRPRLAPMLCSLAYSSKLLSMFKTLVFLKRLYSVIDFF